VHGHISHPIYRSYRMGASHGIEDAVGQPAPERRTALDHLKTPKGNAGAQIELVSTRGSQILQRCYPRPLPITVTSMRLVRGPLS
jgi:hypothetical protein